MEVWMDSRVSVYNSAVRTPKRPEHSAPYPISRPASTTRVHFDSNEYSNTSEPPVAQRPTAVHTHALHSPALTPSGLSQNPGTGPSHCSLCQSGQQGNVDDDELVNDDTNPEVALNPRLITYAITSTPNLDDDELIPKPKGEAGRPGSGGYTVEKVLGWPEQKHTAVKEYVKEQVLKTLNLSVCMTKQPKTLIDYIKETSRAKFPFLDKYKDLCDEPA
ncbi:hypothetical protein PM082_014438 [Marasmius tenuissimus]|nr:hypothetical protein PM082_014438 [Marasmius tenuissimus]